MPDDFTNDIEITGYLAIGGQANGVIDAAWDADWFRVDLLAGHSYFFEIAPNAEGESPAWVSALYDSAGDFMPPWQWELVDESYEFTAPATGTFFVNVEHARVVGDGRYTLSARDLEPVDVAGDATTTAQILPGENLKGVINGNTDADWFRTTLEAGVAYQIGISGAAGAGGTLPVVFVGNIVTAQGQTLPTGMLMANEAAATMTFTPTESGDYYLPVFGGAGLMGSYTLSVSGGTSDDYAGDPSTTGAFEIGGSFSGTIEPSASGQGDVDWFAVTLEAGTLYQLSPWEGLTPIDLLIGLHDAEGRQIARGHGPFIDYQYGYFLVPEDGEYFLSVELNRVSATHSYDYSLAASAVFTPSAAVPEGPVLRNLVSSSLQTYPETISGRLSSTPSGFIVGLDAPEGKILRGVHGADVLLGGTGDDILIGDDTFSYRIYQVEYTRSWGSDRLTPVSYAVSYDIPRAQEVYRAYDLLLDRAPDQVGLKDFVSTGRDLAYNIYHSREFSRVIEGMDDEAFVDFLYTALRGSAPDEDDPGRADHLLRLASGAARSDLLEAFYNSAEFKAAQADEALAFALQPAYQTGTEALFGLYEALLGRAPDAAGFAYWMETLASGEMDEAGIGLRFLVSREYARKAPADEAAFVERLFDAAGGDLGGMDRATALERLESGAIEPVELALLAADAIDAGPAFDLIRAMGRDDILVGGGGDDLLFGGYYADVFVFAPGTAGQSTIMDLEPWDYLDLTAFSFSDAEAARAAFEQEGEDLVFTAQDASFRIAGADVGDLSDALLLI